MSAPTCDLLIAGATVVGEGGAVLPDTTVRISDGRIVEVRPATAADHLGRVAIDGRGKFLAPGLIDTHVHADSDAELSAFIRKGVTSIRYAGNAQVTVDDVHRRINRGSLAPRIFSCGPMIDTAPASYPDLATTVASPAEAAATARRILDAGADALLVVQGITSELAVEVVAVAVDAEVPVFGQIWTMDATEACEAGLSQLDNTSRILASSAVSTETLLAARTNGERISRWRQAWATIDWHETLDMQHAMLSAGLSYCPSLIRAYWAAAKSPATIAAVDGDASAELFDNTARAAWTEKLDAYRTSITSADRAEWDRALDNIGEWIVRFAASGGRVVTGSDSNLGALSFHLELQLLGQLGLSDDMLFAAATEVSAGALGQHSHVGAIQVGRHGDCLLLGADPRSDITTTQTPERVIVGGRVMYSSVSTPT